MAHIYLLLMNWGFTDLLMAGRVVIWPIFLIVNDWYTQFINVIR